VKDLFSNVKVNLAPMEGVVDPLVRKVLTALPGIDLCTTEFVRVTDKIVPPRTFYKYSPELTQASLTDSGVPVMVQLLGGKPEWMAENARAAMKLGAYGIDLNFGCPAKKVNSHDGGAVLLRNPYRLYETIKAVRDAVEGKIPVSAKVRLGCEDKSQYLEIARACDEAKASWMTVHARTKLEGYKPPAHWHMIKDMKDKIAIKVIANGDIFTVDDALECIKVTECNEIMIGRGLIRNPYLAYQIKCNQYINKDKKHLTNILHVISTYVEHANIIYGSTRSISRSKQWLRMVAETNKDAASLFEQVKVQRNINDILSLIKSFT